jgi:hypothetical protein
MERLLPFHSLVLPSSCLILILSPGRLPLGSFRLDRIRSTYFRLSFPRRAK